MSRRVDILDLPIGALAWAEHKTGSRLFDWPDGESVTSSADLFAATYAIGHEAEHGGREEAYEAARAMSMRELRDAVSFGEEEGDDDADDPTEPASPRA